MTKVALATAAAPTFFQPLEKGGYVFVDGGVWANNPIMIALVDALSCFSVSRERVRILSLGCGSNPYVVDKSKMRGGLLAWRSIIEAAMRLQSADALGQAGLLIGANRVFRIDAPTDYGEIDMDDWTCAVEESSSAANIALEEVGQTVESMFLSNRIVPYQPIAAHL